VEQHLNLNMLTIKLTQVGKGGKMKLMVLEKEWEFNNPTYKQKRELWKLNTMTFDGETVNQESYFKLLDLVEEISGLTPEDYVNKDGKELTMAEIDVLLQNIFLFYMGLSEQSKKS